MKKLYVLAGALFVASGAFAQGHELFFSAYNEGAHFPGSTPPGGGLATTGKEKAIQIFNPTIANVDMGQYSVARYSNGNGTFNGVPFQEEQCKRNKPTATSSNTLASSDVFVMGNNESTLLEITSVWDQQASPYNATGPTILQTGGPIDFDGNDAMALRRWTGGVAGQGTPVIVDLIGVVGQNPAGGGWYTNYVVGGQTITVKTLNQSLVRKDTIEGGTRSNPNPATYQIGDEWEVYSEYPGGGSATNTAPAFAQSYANLAGHAARYNGTYGSYLPLGVLEEFNKAITVYPNPATNKEVNIKIDNKKVSSITILNALGQNVKINPVNAAQQNIRVDVSNLKPGLYFVKFVSGDNYRTTIYKELLVN